MRHSTSRARAKTSASFGFEPGPPELDEGDAEGVEQARDAELVGGRQADPLALRPVAQRRVVDARTAVSGPLEVRRT